VSTYPQARMSQSMEHRVTYIRLFDANTDGVAWTDAACEVRHSDPSVTATEPVDRGMPALHLLSNPPARDGCYRFCGNRVYRRGRMLRVLPVAAEDCTILVPVALAQPTHRFDGLRAARRLAVAPELDAAPEIGPGAGEFSDRPLECGAATGPEGSPRQLGDPFCYAWVALWTTLFRE
jgi:hypothetical protein